MFDVAVFIIERFRTDETLKVDMEGIMVGVIVE